MHCTVRLHCALTSALRTPIFRPCHSSASVHAEKGFGKLLPAMTQYGTTYELDARRSVSTSTIPDLRSPDCSACSNSLARKLVGHIGLGDGLTAPKICKMCIALPHLARQESFTAVDIVRYIICIKKRGEIIINKQLINTRHNNWLPADGLEAIKWFPHTVTPVVSDFCSMKSGIKEITGYTPMSLLALLVLYNDTLQRSPNECSD